MLPKIGITTNYFDYKHHNEAQKIMAVSGQSIYTIPEDYIHCVELAGGIPLILPVTDNLRLIQDYVDLCDGIVIIGAVCDIDPQLYGEQASDLINEPEFRNDNFDLALARYVINNSDRPLLGICRGAHVINVAMGGTLYQDVQQSGYNQHCFMDGKRNLPRHQITAEEGSFVFQAVGEKFVQVNSLHHQAVKDLAHMFTCTAKSEDGIIESYEMAGEHVVVGIQWHPEMMLDDQLQQNIIKRFVQACNR